MAIKCYGSLEAYQKSFANQQNPNCEFSDGGFSPTSPNSSSGMTPPSAHVINTTPVKTPANTANKNNNNTRRGSATGGTIRTFGRSIIDTLTGKWGNNQNTVTNNSSTTVQRANTNVGAGVVPSKAAPVSSNRRASTGTHTASP